MFENRTFESIRDGILDKIASDVAKIEGSYTGDIVSSTAYELSKLYAYINSLFSAMFPTADSGEYLVKKCEDYGIKRKAATKAKFEITLLATTATTLPKGTTFRSQNEEFELVDGILLPVNTSTKAMIQCVTPGRVTVMANTIDLQPAISGVSCTNLAGTAGSAEETDEELYERLQIRLRSAPGCGTMEDYKRWVLEVPGIRYAKVRIGTDGKITINVAGPQCGLVGDDTIAAAQAYVDAKRPLGAVVAILKTFRLTSTVTATVELQNGYDIDAVKTVYENVLNNYLAKIAFDDATDVLTIARLTHYLMMVDGVLDITDIKVNGSADNLDISNKIPAFAVILTDKNTESKT